MSQVNVETSAVERIQGKLIDLWTVAEKGFASCSRALESALQKMQNFDEQMSSQVAILQAEADSLEKTAADEQQDYDRKVQDKEEGKTNWVPYYSPDKQRQEACVKRQQARKMQEALEEYHQKCKSFKDVQDRFISEFRKIASGGGSGDKGQLEKKLQHSIDKLNHYQHTLV